MPGVRTQYPSRSRLVQALCPAPKRFLQELIVTLGCRTGLDIGCGAGSPLQAVRGPTFRSVGIDASPDAIALSRAAGVHDAYVCADFMAHDFGDTFDVVVLSHVIEHFTRDQGLDVLRRVEALARTLVYVETPYGFVEQGAVAGNPHQRHLSGWYPEDFVARGYTCFGSGPRILRIRPGGRAVIPEPVRRNLGRLVQRWLFRRPHLADAISAIRHVDGEGTYRAL